MSGLASQNKERPAVAKSDQLATVNRHNSHAILMVSDGPLSGARMTLELGRCYSLGADETSDIVFRGESTAAPVSISVNSDNIQITDSNQTSSEDFAYHDELKFGSTRFFIVKSDDLTAPAFIGTSETIDTTLVDGAIDGEPANAAAAKPLSSAHLVNSAGVTGSTADKASGEKPLQGIRRWLRPVSYATGFATIGVLAFGLYSWQTGIKRNPVAAVAPVESYLADVGYGHLNVDRSSGAATISGYVQTPAQAMELAKLLAGQSETTINKVMVDDEIRDQIENVMRVNGIAGIVESTGNGAFIAHTQLPLGEQLAQLQGLIESDVPLIATFAVNNQSPQLPDIEPESEVVKLDEGKRVVLVNSDMPAYVVTEDQSRYFIGSILPGGYRISDIRDGRVYLEKQGKTTELKF